MYIYIYVCLSIYQCIYIYIHVYTGVEATAKCETLSLNPKPIPAQHARSRGPEQQLVAGDATENADAGSSRVEASKGFKDFKGLGFRLLRGF